MRDEYDRFEATRFEREKAEEERTAKRTSRQQNEQPPINKPSTKTRNKPTGSFNSNDKRKTVLGEQDHNNNTSNNDKHVCGVGYEKTYAPVVQWSTVRMLLTFTIKLGLRTEQAVYLNAFVQADINGNVYYELPMEFSLADGGKSEYVLSISENRKSSVQSQNGSKPTKSGKEKSPVSGHSVPVLAPEGDDLPSPMPTQCPAKRSSMQINSKPVRLQIE